MAQDNASALELHTATFPEDGAVVEQLLREYFAWLELPMTHRGFDEEMQALGEHYSGDAGLLLLLKQGSEVLGCVALQRHDALTAEIRRLYIRPRYSGQGHGELLMKEVIKKATELNYQKLVLGAISKTVKAQALYRKLGFEVDKPFYSSPLPGTTFYARCL